MASIDTTRFGTSDRDTLESERFEATFGLRGDDVFQRGVDPALGFSQSNQVGGPGDDVYRIPDDTAVLIVDDDGDDTVVADQIGLERSSTQWRTTQGGVLRAWDEASSQIMIIADWRDGASGVETFRLADRSVSRDELAALLPTLGTRFFEGTEGDAQTQSEIASLRQLERQRLDRAGINDAPLTARDQAATARGQPVGVEVLANDRDPEGEALQLRSAQASGAGSASVTATGALRYSPPDDFLGTAEATYRVADAGGAASTAALAVTVRLDQAAMATKVTALYTAFFGRAPDRTGLQFWQDKLDTGAESELEHLANQMFASKGARDLFPSGLSDEAVVTRFYENTLGRSPSDSALAFWSGKLARLDEGALIQEMIQAVTRFDGADPAGQRSQALFENKVAVGEYYATQGPGMITGSRALLDAVGASADTGTDAAIASIIADSIPTLNVTFVDDPASTACAMRSAHRSTTPGSPGRARSRTTPTSARSSWRCRSAHSTRVSRPRPAPALPRPRTARRRAARPSCGTACPGSWRRARTPTARARMRAC